MSQRWLVFVLALAACGGETPSTPEPAAPHEEPAPAEPAAEPAAAAVNTGVSFVEPADGATVTSPVTVKFAVNGMEVEPAGEVHEGKGHHHLLIDTDAFEPTGTVVPADDKHIHYGKGQTETTIELAPGEHQLALQFADGAHASYGPEWSAVIHVTVADPAPAAASGE